MRIITKRHKAKIIKNESGTDFELLDDGEPQILKDTEETLSNMDTSNLVELNKVVERIRNTNNATKRMVGHNKGDGQEVILDLKYLVP